MSVWTELTTHMGELLGPRPVAEIVITQYEDDKVNFQIEGMRGPVPPQQVYHLLSIVAQQLIVQVPAPLPDPTLDPPLKETPTV